jgi:hypothetical protein
MKRTTSFTESIFPIPTTSEVGITEPIWHFAMTDVASAPGFASETARTSIGTGRPDALRTIG